VITVFASREGLVGKKTAIGWAIDTIVPFVALPSRHALRRAVLVRNPATGFQVEALVLDVGPWNINDDDYVFGNPQKRPQSETGVDMFGRKTNKAGIDLGEWIWHAIGMLDNGPVEWQFATTSL